jgi:hypothetical protein
MDRASSNTAPCHAPFFAMDQLAAEPMLDRLPAIPDLLEGLLHGSFRLAGLFRFVPDFVILPASYPSAIVLAPSAGLFLLAIRFSLVPQQRAIGCWSSYRDLRAGQRAKK